MTNCIEGVDTPHIVPGEYNAACISYELKYGFNNQPKIYLSFKIEMESEEDIVLIKYFNLKKITDLSKSEFIVGIKSDLFRDTVLLLKSKKTVKGFDSNDFINAYLGKVFIVDVISETNKSNKQSLDKELWYSKVDFIKEYIPVPHLR